MAGVAAFLNWLLLWIRTRVRVIAAIALFIAILLGWREFLIRDQRNAVAAIERAGGSVTYDFEWGNRRISPAPPLPRWRKWLVNAFGPDLAGRVVAVNLSRRNAGIHDSVLKHVGRLSRLESLSFFESAVTDDQLTDLRDLTHLKTLHLHGTQVKGPGLTHLARMVELEDLMLPRVPLSDADIAPLAGITKLKRLDLSGEHLTTGGLAHLGAMTQMESLSLRNTSITSLEPIRALIRLTFLDLVGSPIDDSGLKPVAGFTRLAVLWLGGTKVTDAGLVHLEALPNLTMLDLDRTSVGDVGLGLLCKLPRINSLNLYQTKVTDAGLAGLAGQLGGTSCRNLVVAGPRITPAKLDLLRGKLPRIEIMGPDLKRPLAKAGLR